jgi:signal transduction histidine kinase
MTFFLWQSFLQNFSYITRIQGLRQEFEIQVAALRHHYKNLTLGISGFSGRARRKLEKLQEQISRLPDFVDHTELEALRRSVLNLLAASKSLSTSLTEELVFLKALQSCDLLSEPQDFFPVLRHAIQELVELRFQGKEIEVKINGNSMDEPTSPLVFAFEPYTMEIVLQNLLSNAMRYGDSIQVTAAASVHKVRIEISDNGPGLELEKIKANLILPDKHRAPESTQLGLRTTLYLLDKSGGYLFARNKPGSGATFILEFPQRAL